MSCARRFTVFTWLVMALSVTGCKFGTHECDKICDPFVSAEEQWADMFCGGLEDGTNKVKDDCVEECKDVYDDLSDGDRDDVDECFTCVIDETGKSVTYVELNDALTDDCLMDCGDQDVTDFMNEFTAAWFRGIDYEDTTDPDCGGGSQPSDTDTSGGGSSSLRAMHVEVFDTNGQPVQGASVSVAGTQMSGNTAFNGSLDVTQQMSDSNVGIQVSAPGYVDNVQAITPATGTDRLIVMASLIAIGTVQTINPAAPTPVSHNGATVTFQPNSFVDSMGMVVTSSVEVSFTYIEAGAQLASVGNFLIAGRPGEVLLSLGVVAISAVSGGMEVQLAAGALAAVTIPADTGGIVPTDLPPLWWQNSITGFWEQTTSVWTLQGSQWYAQVDALATWNCDYPNRVTCVSGALFSPDGLPLGGVTVSGTMSGQAANFLPASTVQVATTGSDGGFCMEVVPNSILQIAVTCSGGVKMALDPMNVPDIAGARCGSGSCTELGGIQACCYTNEDCDVASGQTCINGACKQPERCDEQQVAGQDTPETRVVELGASCGAFTFNWQTYDQQDQILVTYEGALLFDSGCIGSSGTETLSFCGTDTTITVSVAPNCAGGSGTAWDFTVSCPI